MKFSKVISLSLAVLMLLLSFAGCNTADKEIVAKIDDTEITMDFFENAIRQNNAYYQGIGFDLSQMLDQEIDGDKTGADLLKEAAMESFILFSSLDKLAADNNIELTAADKDAIKASKDEQIQSMGGRAQFVQSLEESGTSEEYFDYINQYSFLYGKVHDELFHFGKPLAPSPEQITSVMLDEYVRAKHILIQTTEEDEAFAEKKATAESVLARAKAGEDFDALIEEFNEDPGVESSPGGYVFNTGKMAPEFEDAAFSLNDNEISGLVQTSYGFHIIKRLPLTEAYILENIEQFSEDFEQELTQHTLTELRDELNIEYTPAYDNVDIAEILGVTPQATPADDTAPIQLDPVDAAPDAEGDGEQNAE